MKNTLYVGINVLVFIWGVLQLVNKCWSLFEALEMCEESEVKSDWVQVNVSHHPQTNIVTQIT